MLTCVLSRNNLALNASVAKAAGNEDSVNVAQKLVSLILCNKLAVYPLDFNVCAVFIAAVTECLGNRKICVVKCNVLSAKCDFALLCTVVDSVKHLLPFGEVGFPVNRNIKLSAYYV